MLPNTFRQCPLSLLKTPDPLGVRVKRKNYPSAELLKSEKRNSKQIPNHKKRMFQTCFEFWSFDIRICFGFRYLNFEFDERPELKARFRSRYL